MGSNKRDIQATDTIQKDDGELKRSTDDEDKLMKTVLDDDEAQSDGKLLHEASNRGLSFNADIMFDKIVSNFQNAKKLFGETLIRELTDTSPSSVERNAKVPEFKRELKENIKLKLEEFKKKKYIDYHGNITPQGLKLASITLCIQELDKISEKDLTGEKVLEKKSHYGQKDYADAEHETHFRYKDIALKKSVKTAIRRGHVTLEQNDFRVFKRKSKGSIFVMYGLDISGSMTGQKLNVSKKAGIALAYKAINQHDKVGLIAFNSKIVKELRPMSDFQTFVDSIINLKSSKETNLVHAIERAIDLFPETDATKHLLLITDAVPTVGETDQVMEAVMKAKAAGITISVIGVKLTEGLELAETMVEASQGKLYIIRNLEDMDRIILEDYYSV